MCVRVCACVCAYVCACVCVCVCVYSVKYSVLSLSPSPHPRRFLEPAMSTFCSRPASVAFLEPEQKHLGVNRKAMPWCSRPELFPFFTARLFSLLQRAPLRYSSCHSKQNCRRPPNTRSRTMGTLSPSAPCGGPPASSIWHVRLKPDWLAPVYKTNLGG